MLQTHCSKSPDTPCKGLFCDQDRTTLGLMIQKDGDEEITETFCVSSWSSQQFDALRVFINSGAGASPEFAEDLRRIPTRPVRFFHLLHSIFGPEGIKRLYALDTIRLYRQTLRSAGFDYPLRPVPTGPRVPRVVRDLSKGPTKPRRVKQLPEVTPLGGPPASK